MQFVALVCLVYVSVYDLAMACFLMTLLLLSEWNSWPYSVKMLLNINICLDRDATLLFKSLGSVGLVFSSCTFIQ